jgi:Glycosyltransferase
LCDPQIKLLIVGQGSQEQDLRDAINFNNLSKTIFLLGEKNQEWLSKCLPNCSCFLATHTGRALAEASFAGLPVVGYDIDWHSEIVKDGTSGFLIKTGDFKSFSNSILKILNNDKLSEKFSKNIRESAENLLSPKKIIEIEIECFNKLKRIKKFNQISQ